MTVVKPQILAVTRLLLLQTHLYPWIFLASWISGTWSI